MSRAAFRSQCSQWKECLVSCLCCRHRDSHPDEVAPLRTVNPSSTDPPEDRHPADVPLPLNTVNPFREEPLSDSRQADVPPLNTVIPIREEPHPDSRPIELLPTFSIENPSREDVDELLEVITELCEKLKQGHLQGGTFSSRSSRLASKFVEYKESGKSFIDGLPTDLTNQVGQDLLLPLLSKALHGVAGLHWMLAGLSFVAWSLDLVDQSAQNSDKCLELLSRTIRLMRNTKQIWQASSVDVADDLQDTILITLRCALTCASIMKSYPFLRFLNAKTIKESIANLERDLERALLQNTNAAATDTQAGVKALLDERDILQRQITHPRREDIVGEDEVEQEAMDCLEKDCDEIVAVCLQGMGGIGKSTIGGNIFGKFQEKDAVRPRTYKCCRVELPFVTEREELPKFQQQILGKLCGYSAGGFSDCSDGKIALKRELGKIKEPVMLYLDNVLKSSHLSELLPEARYFPKRSRILVSTRHEEVYTAMKRDLKSGTCKLIKVKKLDEQLARELLWKHLEQGNRGSLNAELEALERKVLKLCDGLPLALVLVGGFIGCSESGPTDTKEWKKAIEEMTEVGGSVFDDELYSKLKFSIDHPKIRSAFLDIVAFGRGMPWEMAEGLVGRVPLESLRRRALVEATSGFYLDVSGESQYARQIVRVHDVMNALGLEMVEGDEKEIRVVTKDALDGIRERWVVLEKVVGLMGASAEAPLLVEAPLLQHMPRLRLLRYVRVQGECQAARLKHLLMVDGIEGPSMAFDMSACTALKVLQWKGGDALKVEVTSKILYLYSYKP